MKNILFITGASSDIGIKLIQAISENCVIIAHYHSSLDRLTELSKTVANKIVPVQANLSNEEDIYRMLDFIKSNYGTPNKIVHLAAPKFENIRFKNIEWKKFQEEIDISLKSIVIILHHFLPVLAAEKRGKVVIMLSSVTLNVPPKVLVQYTTIKYALLGLVKSLASDFADKNININAVSPSMVETQFLSKIHDKLIELAAASHPLKRNATIDEIVPTMLLLLSKESDYINGINIPITGGSIF